MLAFLMRRVREEVVGERERTVLRLHPHDRAGEGRGAAVDQHGTPAWSRRRARCIEELRRAIAVEYDDSGQIGRRYRRQDEIGTPLGLTIDEQTLEDDTVTIRDRDSLAQERIPIAGARERSARPARHTVEPPAAEPRARSKKDGTDRVQLHRLV